jgi:BatD DUF11 like domain
MVTRLQLIVSWLVCCLGQQLFGQVAVGGNASSAIDKYVIRVNENAAEKVKGGLFVQVSADKRTCYQGEPVMLTYRFYSPFVNLFTLLKTPSFNGFSVVDMETPDINDYSLELIKGQSYKVYTLRKVQLYPMQIGSLQTDTVNIDNTIYFIKQDYLSRQSAFQQNPRVYLNALLEKLAFGTAPPDAFLTYQTTITSAPVYIKVKDYPAANKPPDFTGATGQFTIAASLPLPQLGTDEVGKLTVTISGKGNMMLLTAPDIQWPQGLEAFEPTLTERVSHTTMPISGSKFFEYKFTAAKPGSYTIPPIHFSWFDPQKGSYQTASTPSLTMKVAQGVQGTAQPAPTAGPEPEREKFFNRLFANRWWVAGPVIGLILLGLFLWVRNENKKDKKAKAVQLKFAETEKPEPIAEPANPLGLAAAMLAQDNSHAFYAQLNKDLQYYITHKMQLPVFSKNTLAVTLDKQGISPATTIELLAVLEALEWQLYTPVSDATQMESLYHRSLSLVESIKYEAKGHRAS